MPAEPATIRVLYVDPVEQEAIALAREMGASRLDVTHCSDAGSAREVLGGERFDVLLLGMDSTDGNASGTEMDPATLLDESERLPVICLLAAGQVCQAADALAAGASNYVIRSDDPDFVRLLVTVIEQGFANRLALKVQRIALIEAEEARERADVLFNEMKHRIANSLALVVSMAHMQTGALADIEARRAMDAFADRVHSFAQVHKGLYDSMRISTLALDTYLEKLVRELQRSHVDKRSVTRLTFESFPASVSVDQAISLGVILSEWVGNAARFAYPGALFGEIRARLLRVDGKRAMLVVEDDGIGIMNGETPGPGLGSQIVGVLAHGLGGWFELKPQERGMVAALHFPLPDPNPATASDAAGEGSNPLASPPGEA